MAYSYLDEFEKANADYTKLVSILKNEKDPGVEALRKLIDTRHNEKENKDVYMVALRFNMPASMLKLVSSIIVIIAISGPYLKSKFPTFKRQLDHRLGKESN